MIEAYEAGDSTYAIGRRFGINRQTVSDHLHRAGVTMRAHRSRSSRSGELVEGFTAGGM